MGHVGAGRAHRQRRRAGVSEEVEYFGWIELGAGRRAERPAAGVEPAPVDFLLRKKPNVLEGAQAEPEAQRGATVGERIFQPPLLGHPVFDFPLALLVGRPAAGSAGESGAGAAVPLGGAEGGRPEGLRLGPGYDVPPEAFELGKVPRIEQLVVGEAGGREQRQRGSNGHQQRFG